MHVINSLIGPILIQNSRVSAKFKLRSTGLSSEISLLRIRRETVTGLAPNHVGSHPIMDQSSDTLEAASLVLRLAGPSTTKAG